MRHPLSAVTFAALTALIPMGAAAQDAGPEPAKPKAEEKAKENARASSRPPVVVELIDGRAYEGELVSRADGQIVLETTAGERVVVPEGAVREIRAAEPDADADPDAPVYEDPQDNWRLTMSALGAGLGALVGSTIILGGIANNNDLLVTTLGVVATPTLAGLGGWYAGSSYDDRATPIGAITGSAIGGFAGLGAGLTLLVYQNDVNVGFAAIGLTFTGLVAGAVIGHELELDLVELEELRLGVAPTLDGGATLTLGGRF